MSVREINVKTGKETTRTYNAEEAAANVAAKEDRESRTTYKEKRAAEYPAIGDQLDAIMKWLATETEVSVPDELKAVAMKCMSVKAKYPKPACAE